MCCRAGAKAPVRSGWAPAVGQGSPGGTCEVRMRSGQGIKKEVGRDGPGQPLVRLVRLRTGLALLCQGAPTGKGAAWACLPAGAGQEQIEGHSAGSCLQQETAKPVARKDCSEPSLTRRTAGTWLRELTASVGCMCKLPRVWEASRDRSVEARIGQLALWKRKVAEMEREASG